MFKAYKCFDKGLKNRYGDTFEIGKVYHASKDIKYGINGNGFHVCLNMEDTLRFFDALNEEVDICEVSCFGKSQRKDDEYYGYYDMYCVENIIINRILERNEIIEHALDLSYNQAIHFISTYRLITEEIELFKEKNKNNLTIMNYIRYYQENDKEAFSIPKIKTLQP